MCTGGWLHRRGELVPGGVDADWHVGLETEACPSDVRVPSVQLGDCEVVVDAGDDVACVVWLDRIEGGTVGGADGADLARL